MGFTPVNLVTVSRCFDRRLIVVKWVDGVMYATEGKEMQSKNFSFEQETEAFAFALELFKRLEM